jgi:cyanophycinase
MSVPFHTQIMRYIRTSFIVAAGCAICLFAQAEVRSNDASNEKISKHDAIKGSLVIIGGALRTDNDAVWKRVVLQAGGKGAKIAVIPAASGKPDTAGKLTADTLKRYGADAFVIPLSVNYNDNSHQNIVKNPQWIARLRQASGVYFTGGDQDKITQVLLQADRTNTPMLDAIWDMYRNGAVIAGTSAGAAIMSTTMSYVGSLSALKAGVIDDKDLVQGLGFIGPKVFVDQHFIIRGRFARMIPIMLKANYQLGLGIDENTAMVITNQTDVEIIGYKGALLVDLSQAQKDTAEKDFAVNNVKLSYLDQGDKFNLLTKVLTVPQDKLKGRVNTSAPYNDEHLFYPDILSNSTAVDLMFKLIDNKQSQAIGLAFSDAEDVRPELGFEFKFSKTAESTGFFSSASGTASYSIRDLRLDIRPVKMSLPLYR